MPVWPAVEQRPEASRARVDVIRPDRVVRTWMREHGVQHGDRIQAVHVEVDGMDDAAPVWVVVALSGLVVGVAEPPIGSTLPGGPAGVYVVRQLP